MSVAKDKLLPALRNRLAALGNSLSATWPYAAALLLLLSCALWRLAACAAIYLDEISYQILNARAGYDHFLYSGLFPMCYSACSISMPWFWRPAKFLYWALYLPVHDFRLFHHIGVAIGLASTGALAWLASLALAKRGVSKALAAGFIVAVCSFGVLPLVLVMNRPESLITICAGWFAFAPFIFRAEHSRKLHIAVVLGSFAVLSLFLGLHPKALLFMPLVLVSLWTLAGNLGGRKASVTACLLALLFAGQSYGVYSRSVRCPESPSLNRINSVQYYMPGPDALSAPTAALKELAGNAGNYMEYINGNIFNPVYMQEWLPHVPYEWSTTRNIMNFLLRAAFNLILFLSAFFLLVQLMRGWRALAQMPGGLVPLALAISLAGLVAIQTAKHFYEGAVIIPLSAVLLCTAFMTAQPEKWWRWMKLVFCASMWLATLSIAFALLAFTGPLQAGYAGYGINLAGYSPKKTVRAVERLKSLSGPDWNRPHIVTDYWCYLYVKNTFQPYNIDYIIPTLGVESGPGALANPALVFGRLKKLQVSSVLARCSYLKQWKVLLDNSIRTDDICYIGSQTIETLATAPKSGRSE